MADEIKAYSEAVSAKSVEARKAERAELVKDLPEAGSETAPTPAAQAVAEPKPEAKPRAAASAKAKKRKPARTSKQSRGASPAAKTTKKTTTKTASKGSGKKFGKGSGKKPAPTAKAATKTPATPSLTELKETIMTKKTTDFSKTVQETAAEMQSRLKSAYDKGSEFVSEATEFNKANVEAFVETSKVLAGAAQEIGRTAVEDTKNAFETMTADTKKIAAVKSPTELLQLQGELAQRNFDAMVAFSSKSTENFLKLANEAFAPLSSRMSVAAEKISKAA